MRRALETSDASDDFVIPVGTAFTLGWVVRTDDSIFSKHQFGGNLSITLQQPVIEPSEPDPVVEPSEPEPVVEPSEPEPVVEPSEPEPVVEPSEPEPVVEPADSVIDDLNVPANSEIAATTTDASTDVPNQSAAEVAVKSCLSKSWNGYDLKTCVDLDTQELVFTALVKDNSWFSIGFGPSMKDTDMIAWHVRNGVGETVDYYSTGYRAP